MKVPLAVVADYANLSADGKLNIMGVFTRVNVGSLPAALATMQLVVVLEVEPAERGSEKRLEIKLLDPDARVLLGIESVFGVAADAPLGGQHPQIVQLNQIKFDRAGPHAFHILVNGETKLQVPFDVVLREQRKQGGQEG